MNFEQNSLSYAIVLSKSNRITQCDQIQSYNRGHYGGVSFDFVSLIHWKVRVGGPSTKKQNFIGQEVSNNKSLWE